MICSLQIQIIGPEERKKKKPRRGTKHDGQITEFRDIMHEAVVRPLFLPFDLVRSHFLASFFSSSCFHVFWHDPTPFFPIGVQIARKNRNKKIQLKGFANQKHRKNKRSASPFQNISTC